MKTDLTPFEVTHLLFAADWLEEVDPEEIEPDEMVDELWSAIDYRYTFVTLMKRIAWAAVK